MHFRIATWNLARPTSAARQAGLVREIDRIGADIWIFTETHLEVTPGRAYACASTTASDRPQRPGEAWTAIWSRFPMTPLGPTSDPARAIAVRIEPPARPPIVVYGTVLPWLGSPWRDFPAAGARAFIAALDAQRADWSVLRATYPDCELVVAGDFNQDLHHRHYYGSRTGRLALRAALEAEHLMCLTSGSDDPVATVERAPHASIDHICVTKLLAQRAVLPRTAWPATSTPDQNLSDHFGVAVDVESA